MVMKKKRFKKHAQNLLGWIATFFSFFSCYDAGSFILYFIALLFMRLIMHEPITLLAAVSNFTSHSFLTFQDG
jgi:hypothetical protein